MCLSAEWPRPASSYPLSVSSVLTDTDSLHLARTLELAQRGRGRVTSNPLVGAVIARGEEVLGEGFHAEYGGPHAEVEAIRAAAGADLTETTIYISLEPCCHEGKTPPCTDSIIAAGIKRVVIASDDPSEHANGRSLGILRDEGIEVVIAEGETAQRARDLNQAFRKHARSGRPYVIFKSAMTLDGKVATATGSSQWISCEESRELAHRWRAECDAVAVGIGTALADDPQLTARAEGVQRQPRRIVFDSECRLPVDSKLVGAAPDIPLTVVTSRAAPAAAMAALEGAGAELVVAAGENEQTRVQAGLDQLGATGVTSILLEGGPKLAGAFFDAGEIDEWRVFLAPLLIGGKAALDPLEGKGIEEIADAKTAETMEVEQVGRDLLVTARLKVW